MWPGRLAVSDLVSLFCGAEMPLSVCGSRCNMLFTGLLLEITLCYAIVLPGRKSSFRVGFPPDSSLQSIRIGPSTGRRTDFEALPISIRPKSGPEARFLARKHYSVT